MAYSKAHYDFGAAPEASALSEDLGLKNLGLSIYVFAKGEGFDFFHNHREQEEIYLCLEGSADLKIGGDDPETLRLERGDAVRVDPRTLRAIGNERAERGVILIAGACPHPYPAGIGHHDVIADVLSMSGHGTTGFELPAGARSQTNDFEDPEC